MAFFSHLNINSLSNIFDDFNKLINDLKLHFDILGISESNILKSQCSTTNVSLQNFVIEKTSTKSTAGELLLYFDKRHSYKACPYITIQKALNLESVYIEIILPNKSNLIVGCTYRYLCVDVCTFHDHVTHYQNKSSKEANKTIVLLGDFNIDLFTLIHQIMDIIVSMTQLLTDCNLRFFFKPEFAKTVKLLLMIYLIYQILFHNFYTSIFFSKFYSN